MSVAAVTSPPESSVLPVQGGTTGWPLDPRERGDFCHPPRAFPRHVVTWRRQLVEQILKGRRGFTIKSTSIEDVRSRLDLGIAHLRDVAKILAMVHDTPGVRSNEDAVGESDFGRVLSRLGPYRELGLSLAGLDHKRLQAELADLVPPTLRDSLRLNLVAHGRAICRAARPLCERCEIRNLCATYRRREAARSGHETAPTAIDLFCGPGGYRRDFAGPGRGWWRPWTAIPSRSGRTG